MMRKRIGTCNPPWSLSRWRWTLGAVVIANEGDGCGEQETGYSACGSRGGSLTVVPGGRGVRDVYSLCVRCYVTGERVELDCDGDGRAVLP